MIKIIVDSEEEKSELLVASEHFHDCDINTDLPGVNFLAHMFMNPDLIIVKDKDE